MKLGSVTASQLELLKVVVNERVKLLANNDEFGLELGKNLERIWTSFDLNSNNLQIANRWSIEKYLRLGKAIIEAFNMPNLGLKLGERTLTSHLGLVGLGCQVAPDLFTICQLLTKYEPLVFDNVRGQSAFLSANIPANNGTRPQLHFYSIAPYSVNNRFIVDSVLLGWHQIITYLTGRFDLIESVNFEFGVPVHADEYFDAFHCKVNFNQKGNYMVFAANAVQAKNKFASYQTYVEIEEVLNKALSEFVAANNIEIAVKQSIVKLISAQAINMSLIAKDLQIPVWTLKRQLAMRKTSFQLLYNQTRLNLANAYLKQGNFSVAKTAELTGFSSSTAFQHAYKRWTGVSPGSIRNNTR